MKRDYYDKILREKLKNKIKIKELYNILMKEFLDIYNNHKLKYKSFLNIPKKIYNYFIIKEFNKNEDNNISFDYIIHNPLLVRVSI